MRRPSTPLRSSTNSLSALALLGALLPAQTTSTPSDADWPRWRGARHDDTARAGGALARPFELVVRWRRAIGTGYAGVSVRGDLALTMAASAGSDLVLALDAHTGEERWRHGLGPAFAGQDGATDGPVATPTVEGDSVYALSPRGELVALALATGAPRWSVDLVATHGAPRPHWGFTSAPLCVGDLGGELVVVATGAPEGRAFQAFDARDGSLRWSAGSDAIHYQSPILARVGDEELVVAAGNTFLFGLEPASGAVRWRLPHGGRDFYATVVQPTALGDGRFLLKNQGLHARCVQLVTEDGEARLEERWSTRYLSQNYNVAVAHDGLLFGHNGGFLACLDAESGDLLWRSRPPGDGWLLLVDDQLVILTKDGGLHVAPASPDGYEERATLPLFEHLTWTPPSFAHGRIYARDSYRDLACVEIVPRALDAAATRAGPRAPATAAASAAPRAAELGRWMIELRAELRAAADPGAVVERFLAAHPTSPAIEDGRIAHFLYHGKASAVVVRGDLVADTAELALERIADTDLFHAAVELAPDARLAYQLVRDDEHELDQVLVDPRNPRQAASTTLVGPVSELLMPAAEPPPAFEPEARALESFVLDVPVSQRDGRAFGGPRRVWVSLPPDYAASERRYPVLYVNDGASARDPIGVPALLAELAAAGRPVLGVFVERQGPYELARGEQDLYRELLVTRLVPHVDGHYRTLARPEARILLGWDEGAYAALFAALGRQDVFGAVGAQSLYHGSSQGQRVLEELVRTAPALPTVYLDWGRYDARDPRTAADTARSSRALADALEARGARVRALESNDGDHAAFWRARLPALLRALVPAGA